MWTNVTVGVFDIARPYSLLEPVPRSTPWTTRRMSIFDIGRDITSPHYVEYKTVLDETSQLYDAFNVSKWLQYVPSRREVSYCAYRRLPNVCYRTSIALVVTS